MKDHIKEGQYYIEDCSAEDLARKYGTPLYVYSETELEDRLKELIDDFTTPYPDVRVAYAAKAFCVKSMLRKIADAGMCVDVVSGGELYTAMAVGFPPESIEFNGNNKQKEEIEMAVDYGIGRIIIDGMQELSLIEEVCRQKQKQVKVLYRVTPGVKADSHDYMVTGKKDSKFGIPLDDHIILPAIEAAIKSPYVDFMGFHFHVGSQLFDNTPYLQALDIVLALAEKTRQQLGYVVKELNLGGGFGACYVDEIREPYRYFLDPMMARIEEFFRERKLPRPAVVIEPGRSIVAEAGVQLYTIGSIKDIPDVRKYISVDGGMTDNIRPALYGSRYCALVAGKADVSPEETVTVCGKCCESGDILIKDLSLPKTRSGDILVVKSAGAYNYAMASNYNKNPIPAVVFVKGDKSRLVVRRQTYEEIIEREL